MRVLTAIVGSDATGTSAGTTVSATGSTDSPTTSTELSPSTLFFFPSSFPIVSSLGLFLRAAFLAWTSLQPAHFSSCLNSDQVLMATILKSRLYSCTGLRKTGAVASVADLAFLVEMAGAGMAKRIEVVDSVWRTNPGGTVRSAVVDMMSIVHCVSTQKERAYVELVRPLRLILLIFFSVLVRDAWFSARVVARIDETRLVID